MSRLLLFAIVLACGCTGRAPDPWANVSEPKVVATFAPLHCFALNVVGNESQVKGLLSTQDPHHGDPPPSQAEMLAHSNILFANGLGIDNGVIEKMRSALGKSNLKVFRVAEEIPKEDLLEGGACACCKEEGHVHDHGPVYDGHVWLGIDQAKKIVRTMADKLQESYPGKADWKKNADDYCSKLDKLKADGLAMLKDKKERAVLPYHGSMTYFAKTFDLKLMDPMQDVPGQEPTSQRLDMLVEKCLKEKVRVIAVEPVYGAEASAQTLLAELKKRGLADAVIIVLDPLETATESEFNAGWYEAKMRKNLETLAQVLK